MTRQVVANMEARRRRIYEHQIRLVIKVSHCTLDELFFGVPPAMNRNPPPHSKQPRR
jgi:hypothetical protein